MGSFDNLVRHFRLRHGLSQATLAGFLRVPQRNLVEWEAGRDEPSALIKNRIVRLGHNLPEGLLKALTRSVVKCDMPRAMSRTDRLNLQAISGPAIDKRPSIVNWMGRDLLPIATGILEMMLDDRELQRGIAKREIASVVTTTRSVLRTAESEEIGTWRTSINYFFHNGVIYSDAVSVPALEEEPNGYTPILIDELGSDLFGDYAAIEAGLARTLSDCTNFDPR